jgi:hypothetical protein
MMLDLTLEDWINLIIHLKDKNNLYINRLFAADCDIDKMVDIDKLSDDEINDRLEKWSVIYNNIKDGGQWINELSWNDGSVKKLKGVFDITTEDWIRITDYLDNSDHIELVIPYIIQALLVEKIEWKEIINQKCWAEMVNISGFFLQKVDVLQIFIQMYLELEPEIMESLKWLMNNELMAGINLN